MMQHALNHSSEPLSILLVDDSASERNRLSAILRTQQHKVVESPDGISALNYLSHSANEIDMVLLDVRMPGTDGFDTASKIRMLQAKAGNQWCPIIFLSGRSTPADVEYGIWIGGDDFLTKPVEAAVLKAKVSAMRRIAESHQQLVLENQCLETQANTDELTQLSNRRHFLKVLDTEIARARRHGSPLSFAYVDIDHFKYINDELGHEAGDLVLKQFSGVLRDGLRSEDAIGRLGGEEFGICLPGADAKASAEPCERYRKMIECLPISTQQEIINITASFGLTDFRPETDTRDDLLARADSALYRAKDSGRNRVALA